MLEFEILKNNTGVHLGVKFLETGVEEQQRKSCSVDAEKTVNKQNFHLNS